MEDEPMNNPERICSNDLSAPETVNGADSSGIVQRAISAEVAALERRIAEVKKLKASAVNKESFEIAYGWSCHIAGLEWALLHITSADTGADDALCHPAPAADNGTCGSREPRHEQ
jgi:hypothetical protein